MGGDLAFFDIIFFALVAGFLILRLRSVLGRRTGSEKSERWTPRLPRTPAQGTGDRTQGAGDRTPGPATVTPLPGARMPPQSAAAASAPLDTALAQIKSADPSFDPARFIDGARAA